MIGRLLNGGTFLLMFHGNRARSCMGPMGGVANIQPQRGMFLSVHSCCRGPSHGAQPFLALVCFKIIHAVECFASVCLKLP